MTVQQAVQRASQEIAKRDAEVLLLHVVQRDRAWLMAHPEAELDEAQAALFLSDVARRAQHWPMQYLTGKQEFFGLPLQVSSDVLIPRPETELLVEAVLRWIAETSLQTGESAPQVRVVDVGSGSGAIALALASRLSAATIFAVDISPAALRVAEANARRLGLEGRVRFQVSDVLAAFRADARRNQHFDVIVSNPPYVPAPDASTMQPEVRDFEPHLALFAGDDGLDVYRRLIPQAGAALRPGGLLAMEFGFGQKSALAGLLTGWNNVTFLQDYAAIPRIVLAERPAATR